jgi:hypothetical protein
MELPGLANKFQLKQPDLLYLWSTIASGDILAIVLQSLQNGLGIDESGTWEYI